MHMKTLNPDFTPDFRTFTQMTLIRPLRLLCTEPIIIMVAVVGSVTCDLFYLSAESLLLVFQAYRWNGQSASLSFIPIMIGCLAGFLTRLYDHHHLANRVKSGRSLEPEHKLLGLSLARPSLAAGKRNEALQWPLPSLSSPFPQHKRRRRRSGRRTYSLHGLLLRHLLGLKPHE